MEDLKRVILMLGKAQREYLAQVAEETGASRSWQVRRLINVEIERKKEADHGTVEK